MCINLLFLFGYLHVHKHSFSILYFLYVNQAPFVHKPTFSILVFSTRINFGHLVYAFGHLVALLSGMLNFFIIHAFSLLKRWILYFHYNVFLDVYKWINRFYCLICVLPAFLFLSFYMCINLILRFWCLICLQNTFFVLGVLYVY